MKKLIAIFVKFPFYANIIIAVTIIAGLMSLSAMKMSFFPELTSRNIYVNVYYPGASPVEMEEGVTSRIEEAIRGLVGVKEITSTSSENSTSVQIETTGQFDIDETLMDVKNAVDGISSFPSAAERPIVYKQRSSSMAAFISFSGDVDLETIKFEAQRAEEEMLASGIVSQVTLMGYPSLEISVEIKEADLLRYGLTFDEIAGAISSNNQDFSGGVIRSKEEEVLIRLRSRSADPDKIGNIILRSTSTGGVLRIRDIAEVKRKFADVASKTEKLGNPLVSMMITKLNSEDLASIDTYIYDYQEKFNNRNSDVKMEVSFSFMEMLQSRLNLLSGNGITGLILVIITLALFLSFRLSLWVAWGIPCSFLMMFVAANLMGITINMISLFGMILVIGILVDDGVVIGENIYQHFERGKSPMQSAVDGTVEVFPAVVTSVSTTIVAFMPLLFLKNQMEQMKEMAIVVILCLAFSLVEAMLVLPAHVGSKSVLRRKSIDKRPNALKRSMEQFIVWIRDGIYHKYLVWGLRWRYIMVASPIAIVLITAGLMQGGLIKSTIFPAMEFDSFTIDIAFTPGSGERQTEEYMAKFEKIIWEVNDEMLAKYPNAFDDIKQGWWDDITGTKVDTSRVFIDNVYLNLGSSFSGQESGSHAGSVNVYPRNLEGTGVSSHEIMNSVRDKIGECPEIARLTVAGQALWGKPVSISLLGRDVEELEKAKKFLYKKLEEKPELKDIVDNNSLGKQEVSIKLKPKAYSLGLSEGIIMNQVRQGFYGGQAQRLQEGRDELRVWVRYPAKDRERLGQLERMKIKTTQGTFPLMELVDYSLERSPVSIKRYNGLREIRVEADIVDPDESVTDLLEEVSLTIVPELKSKFSSVDVVYQGQQKESGEAMAVVGTYYTIAFFIIVLILMIHFKSFQQPMLILIMIPLSIIGSIWGHGIHGKPVSMLSLWGIVALSGVIINDAVVFMSRYNDMLLEGLTIKRAILDASKSRMRAIILTTLTTSIGLFPLILEKSFQAQFLIPMAISLAYGVAFGTLFILMYFPLIINILNDINRVIQAYISWVKGSKFELPPAESVEIANKNFKRRIEGIDSSDYRSVVSGDMNMPE